MPRSTGPDGQAFHHMTWSRIWREPMSISTGPNDKAPLPTLRTRLRTDQLNLMVSSWSTKGSTPNLARKACPKGLTATDLRRVPERGRSVK